MPINQDKTRRMLTLDNEREGLPNSGWLAASQFSQDAVSGEVTLMGGTSGAVVFTTSSTPAALPAGNTNDFALPAGVSRIRFSANAAGSVLTGLGAGTDGQVVVIQNISANDLTLSPEDVLSVAANRFAINGSQILGQNQSLAFMYDTGIARWTAWGV